MKKELMLNFEMFKAKLMFEKLGYERDITLYDKDSVLNLGFSLKYEKTYKNGDYSYIRFHEEDKSFSCYEYGADKQLHIDTKLLQAINQQMKALGWND